MRDLVDRPAPEVVYETEQPVLYETQGAVSVISLNRPRYGNAQNGQLLYALDEAFMRAVNDDAIGAIVLRGEGKHFSSGHDLGTPGNDSLKSRDRKTVWYDYVNKPGAEFAYAREHELYLGLCRRWRELPKPTVAAVQGACIAGGLMLAWVCDLIVASEDAYFSDPVVGMGVPGVEYFAHAFEMPSRAAREFLLLGERMSAERAYQVGMINRVVPEDEMLAEACAIAQRLAEKPRFALALTKRALNYVDDVQGKRTAMEGVFGMHHLSHAHNSLVSGSGIGGVSHKDIKKSLER